MENIRVSMNTAINLFNHGISNVTRHCYVYETGEQLPFFSIPELEEVYPAISLHELLNFLWSNSWAVCIKYNEGVAWADDEASIVIFKVESEEERTNYNQADLVANILIQMIRKRHFSVDYINSWNMARSNEWKMVLYGNPTNESSNGQ
jgi:hypothetical protein